MQGARTLIENSIASPGFATILAGYGYDAARLEEGRNLWTVVDGLAKKQVADHGGSTRPPSVSRRPGPRRTWPT